MASSGIHWLDRLMVRFRALVARRRLDRDLTEELAFHQASLIEQFRREGLSPGEATRRARLEMGGPAQVAEASRDQRGWLRLERLERDTRLAFRTFARYPGFTLTAVLTIAVGMGANTTLFTLMHGLLFRALPIAAPETVRNVYLDLQGSRQRSGFGSSSFISFVEFQQVRAQATTAEIAGIAPIEMSRRGIASTSVQAQLVSDNLLSVIGARPVLGRFFNRNEAATPGGAPVAVLSHRFWRRELAADPAIVGKTITLNRTSFTVIGVADSATRGPLIQPADLWIPLTMQRITRPGEPLVDDPTAGWIQVFARKRPGVSDPALEAEMRVLGPRAVASHDTSATTIATVVPASFLNTPKLRRETFPALALVWIAVALILVVACANVANMLLARGLSRRREIAIRLAIGADRRRVLGQLLTESAWLGLLGGGLGLAIAMALGRLVPAFLPAGFEMQMRMTPDRAILAFTGAVSILSGIAFGLLPALQSTRLDLSAGLKVDGLQGTIGPKLRLQGVLVGMQVAGCVVLLAVAGLLIRSFGNALTMDLGRPLDHMLIVGFDLRQQQYTAPQGEQFLDRLVDEVDRLPAVVRGGVSILDPELGAATNFLTPGDSVGDESQGYRVGFDEVGAGYFAAAGLPLLAGRTFTAQEVKSKAAVMVVDQRFADSRFGGRAVGQSVWLSDGQGRRRHEIIGVVGSTVPIGIGREILPTYYVPMVGLRFLEAKLWIRYRGEPGPVATAVRRAVETIDPEVTVRIRTIEDNVREALTPLKVLSGSLTALGGIALALASIGLFGVIGFSVGRRSREIAVRMALGATPGQVVGLVFRQGARPVLGGLAAGLALALAGGRLIQTTLVGVSPFDPLSIGAVVGLVSLAAAAAFAVPARRAAAVRPGQLLRVD